MRKMCLGIPARIVEVKGNLAKVEVGGVVKEARLDLIEDAKKGEYVILHAGFAIQKLDEREARETLKLLNELASKG